MQPQYIYDNSVTPPAQSLLQYSIAPDILWITTSNQTQTIVSLIITAYNNSQQAVQCRSLIFGILQGTTASFLSPNAANLPCRSDQQAIWKDPAYQSGGDPLNPNLYLYKTTPVTQQSGLLQPGQTLIFRINNIQVTKAEGVSQLTIREMAGGNLVNGSLPVQILNNQMLQIVQGSFQNSPASPINPGDQSQLTWAIFNADHWKLFNWDAAILLYKGNGQSSLFVKPLENTNYQLIAYADVGETIHTSAYTAAMVNPVTLTANINGQQSVTVDAQTPVLISWQTQLANKIKLHADDGTSDQLKDASSGSGTFNVTPMQNTVYTLSAYYEDATQTPPVDSTLVSHWVTVNVNPPQIKSFTTSTQVPSIGAAATLYWQIESASVCSVTPPGTYFRGANALQGSTQVTPAANNPPPYTLLASAGAQSQPSSLQLRPMPHGWTNFSWPAQWSPSALVLFNYQGQVWLTDTWNFNQSYRTSDGQNWTQVNVSTPATPVLNANPLVFDDGTGLKMWLVGGTLGMQNPATGYALASSDGANWTKVQPVGTTWGPRVSFASVVFQGKIWVMGGMYQDAQYNVTFYSDVWNSADGKNWTQVSSNWPFSAHYNMKAAVFNGEIWLCGGTSYINNELIYYAEAWHTSDGVNWTQWNDGGSPPKTATPWGARVPGALLTVGENFWLLGGMKSGGQNYVWDMWSMDKTGRWTLSNDACPQFYNSATTLFDWRIWQMAGWFSPGSPLQTAFGAAYYVP
jgi:hypothetical protein